MLSIAAVYNSGRPGQAISSNTATGEPRETAGLHLNLATLLS